MKALKLNTLTKNIFVGLAATMMIFIFNSCAKKATATEVTFPEEKGNLQVKRDVNSNYVIQIELSDLEAVSKLQPAKDAYVVWMVSDKKTTNLGQIEGAKTWLSKKAKANFEAVSKFKPSKVFITAENDANAQRPGSFLVWSTRSF